MNSRKRVANFTMSRSLLTSSCYRIPGAPLAVAFLVFCQAALLAQTGPTISTISPMSGGPNTFVTISGSGFGSTVGSSSVTFNGVSASPTTWGDSSITVAVPGNASTGPVVVKVGGVSSNGVAFTFSSQGTISGTVTRLSDGSPLNGATVEAMQSGSVIASATTNSSGMYSLLGVPGGVYTMWFFAPSLPPQSQTAASIAGATTTLNVTLGAPAITSLSPSMGSVGTTMTIAGAFFGATQGPSTVTFNGVVASPTSWTNTSIVVPVPSGATTGPVVVTVATIPSNGMTFTVGTGSISGTVSNGSTGINGTTVQALQSNVVKASSTTNSAGSYTLSSLAPGTYDVRVSAAGYGTSVQSGNSVSVGGSTTLNFILGSPGTISGVVTASSGGAAVSGASITLSQGTDTVGSATTDNNGNYSVSNLATGSYTMRAVAPGFNIQTQSGVTVSAGTNTTLNITMVGQSTITYSYDQLGRLTGVVDSQSDAVTYNYDAVGNLLAITRNSSSQVSISGFAPQSGPVGTSVTISGSGFSNTPSQDGVSFNGVSANITSATPTQLVSTVPAGATTGSISVTAPSGSASSPGVFTVTSSNGVPTISSFSPTIGTVGTAVTISGSNFDSTPGNDRAGLNVQPAQVSSATATAISTNVPVGATSGHLWVTTRFGQATTSGYFFVPPAPYTAANVGFTGAIGIGGTITASITTAGQIALIVFDGVGGQRISVNLTNGTFPGCSVTVRLISPQGSNLFSNTCMGGSSGFIDALTLPTTGTYSILLAPGSTRTGSQTLTLYSVQDSTATISPGGSPVSFSLSTPGQNEYLSFAGTAGQQVSMNLTGTFASCSVTVSIVKPDGTMLPSTCVGGSSTYIDTQTLPQTGNYAVKFDPQGAGIGSATLTLYNVVNQNATITIDGPSVSFTLSTPGQIEFLTFSGTAGQQVFLNMTAGTLPGCFVTLSIFNPDGSTLYSNSCWAGSSSNYVPTQTLPLTGNYTIKVDPQGAGTGSATLSLVSVTNQYSTISIGGPSVSFTLSGLGETEFLTFSGTAGQQVFLTATSGTFSTCGVNLYITKPDGTTLYSTTCWGGSSNYVPTQTLPQTGTYTIKIVEQGKATGGMTLALYNVVNQNATISIGGSSVSFTLSTPGETEFLTFSGTANQQVLLNMTGGTFYSCGANVYILNPDGTTLYSSSCFGGSTNYVPTQTLPQTGTYTIKIVEQQAYTGSMTLTLYNVVNQNGTISIGGPSVSFTLSGPGETEFLTFSGSAGQQVFLNMTNGTFPSCGGVAISILNPDGSTLYSNSNCWGGSSNYVPTQTLPQTGTYTIKFAPKAAYTGSATLTLYNVVNQNDTISIGGSSVSFTLASPGETEFLTFSGTAGQQVFLNMTGGTFPGCWVTLALQNPDGSTLYSNTCWGGGSQYTGTLTLAQTGTYTLKFAPQGAYTGSATLTLYNVVNGYGTISIGGPSVSFTLSAPGETEFLTFSGTAGQQIHLNMTNGTFPNCWVTLSILNPNGSTLYSTSCWGGTTNSIPAQTLGSTGTYTIKFAPQAAYTGSATLTLN